MKYTKPILPLIINGLLILTTSGCGVGVDTLICGSACSNVIIDSKPTLTFYPTSGPVGTLITITGIDLSSFQSVSVSGVPAIVVRQTSGSLVVFVMPGSTSGELIVTTANDLYFGSNKFTLTSTGVPANQQGFKLTGTGAVGSAAMGKSVAISADGNAVIAGGNYDNTNVGGAWFFTRSGTTWIQQGSKLVASDSVGTSYQGWSVGINADGTTAIVGGIWDNGTKGASWIYTRSGTVWSQQGPKLVGSTASGTAGFGRSVALSVDGDTAIIGANNDNIATGAVWFFVRSGGVWTQQGLKLVGSGAVGAAHQGVSSAISADGNTSIVGGDYDNSNAGAAWIFTRSNSIWTQQGLKLVGSGATGAASQGISVALSSDGSTAVVGGNGDNGGVGAAWVFTQSGGVWIQQGPKLVGSGAIGSALEGSSLSLSADGNSLLIGGSGDNANIGAVWIFTRSNGIWTQQGSKLVGTGNSGNSYQGTSVGLSSDGFTAIVGGSGDGASNGASWIFTP